MGPKKDEEELRKMFHLAKEEPYVILDEGWDKGLSLPYDLGTHIYVFFLNNFPDLKAKLEEAGWKEWEDYVDGKSLILPHSSRLVDEYRIFMVI